jgi:hypothetical protein
MSGRSTLITLISILLFALLLASAAWVWLDEASRP